jgi:hypothetical protein
MSNNQQTMKLYTEEQVKDMLNGYGNFEDITPIELPSDEDIYNEAQIKKDNIKKLPFDSASFQFGAMWLKDKIQGGNK